jgi:hypothetical protein
MPYPPAAQKVLISLLLHSCVEIVNPSVVPGLSTVSSSSGIKVAPCVGRGGWLLGGHGCGGMFDLWVSLSSSLSLSCSASIFAIKRQESFWITSIVYCKWLSVALLIGVQFSDPYRWCPPCVCGNAQEGSGVF